MILQQLTLRNYCLFHGRQVFDLAPVQRAGKYRPIILFGGINGGGKTTLFDAIQLALYGPRARCAKRANLTYHDFLLQSIHHGIPPSEGAGIALSFRYLAAGEEREYEVRRNWRVQDDKEQSEKMGTVPLPQGDSPHFFRPLKVSESLVVLQDGLPNQSLSRDWPQAVEEMIPLEISQLFFFDGEKIRTLAEDNTSSAALGAAIKALLGLDIVERLIADASVLQTRLGKEAQPPEHGAAVHGLEEQLRRLQAELEQLQSERSSLENNRLRAEAEQDEARQRFAAAGGQHWNARVKREQRLEQVADLVTELEGQLVLLAAGGLPLALVPDLLARVAEQDVRERQAAESEVVLRLLTKRDEQLLEILRSAQVSASLLRLVEKRLLADREGWQMAGAVVRRLNLSENARALLQHLRAYKISELSSEARRMLERLASLYQERDDLQHALAATPEEADIRQFMDRLEQATAEFARLKQQADRLDNDIRAKKAEVEACESRLRQHWQANVKQEFEREDRGRMVQLAGRTRAAMQEFLRRATEQKIDRLSGLITESFRFLLRKQTLVERILIDPATFAITLYDAAGTALPRQRLSEGEKQIFAIAMLWGLARASARPLPAVIDTPMARLDAAHRQHLVERYFPNASHQVVILSTDTEVDRHYYELLRPAIARAYHLNYEEQEKRTVGEEGYFWKGQEG